MLEVRLSLPLGIFDISLIIALNFNVCIEVYFQTITFSPLSYFCTCRRKFLISVLNIYNLKRKDNYLQWYPYIWRAKREVAIEPKS